MKRRPGPRSLAQQAWARSAEFHKIGSAAAKRNLLRFRLGPKCGAKTKRDGHPCQHPAMANGRCYRHGGRTPKGNDWHRPVWPDAASPNAEAKLQRKLRDQRRDAKRRAKRLAAMTPEQQAEHENWQRTHRPGPAAKRALTRKERADADSFSQRANAPEPEPSPEQVKLRKLIAALEAELERRRQEDLFE